MQRERFQQKLRQQQAHKHKKKMEDEKERLQMEYDNKVKDLMHKTDLDKKNCEMKIEAAKREHKAQCQKDVADMKKQLAEHKASLEKSQKDCREQEKETIKRMRMQTANPDGSNKPSCPPVFKAGTTNLPDDKKPEIKVSSSSTKPATVEKVVDVQHSNGMTATLSKK